MERLHMHFGKIYKRVFLEIIDCFVENLDFKKKKYEILIRNYLLEKEGIKNSAEVSIKNAFDR
jgi:hypothetical protein